MPGTPEESRWRSSWLDSGEQRESGWGVREIEVGELDCYGEDFGPR